MRLSSKLVRGTYGLRNFLPPQRVALVGASEKPASVGRAVMENLIKWGGVFYPVNPYHSEIFGRKSYPNIESLPESVDLAIIATPASTVPAVIEDCVRASVKGAVVLSAGFKEIGESGRILEEKVVAIAKQGGLRLIGPNCIGLILPHARFNGTFLTGMPKAGHIAFLSQSGALGAAVLDWSFSKNIGFSAFVSLGSMADVDWGDILFFLAEDSLTRVILIYMESIGDPSSFLSAARQVNFQKPILVLKAGRSKEGSRAALSHTGSMTGSDEVLDAAFLRTGVLRVASFSEFFSLASFFSQRPLPVGPRLVILTNAGGAGVLATDRLVITGGELANLSETTIQNLNEFLPQAWSHGNPVDIIGDADAQRYHRALDILSKEKNTDGILVILTKQAMTDPEETAKQVVLFAKNYPKPILCCWMGGESVHKGRVILEKEAIPTFEFPEEAAEAFSFGWLHRKSFSALYETPMPVGETDELIKAKENSSAIIYQAKEKNLTLLTEYESKKILRFYGIDVNETFLAKDSEEAISIAEEIGYPVVAKLNSTQVTHKSDIGGVILGISDKDSLKRAFEKIRQNTIKRFSEHAFGGITIQKMITEKGIELILGGSVDPQFGPVMLFGSGGVFVEIYKDRALALPPLTTVLSSILIGQTKIAKALDGFRGVPPIDRQKLNQTLVRFSELLVNERRIKEIDVNPLFVHGEKVIALDARIILHPFSLEDNSIPSASIRPYPLEYIWKEILLDGTKVLIRPIKPEDEPLMREFHKGLSQESVYYRYFQNLSLEERIDHQRLSRICFSDYSIEIVLVVQVLSADQPAEIIGVGRLGKYHGFEGAEFALIIQDRWQNKGLGTLLVRKLKEIGRKEKLSWIIGRMLPLNESMKKIADKEGFSLYFDESAHEYIAELDLRKEL
ncbi:bifunctional acetate--CoA ligase family protein/GNAT family N-acetyltransferase [Methylacidiphilum caldifontis]|uniref:Acetyl CoA synthetase subunit alpha n=1 Tax=Methylacidiphilum caldifontis TaxID=2795386 RepID=A0A4Y8PG30_9BACT|nr:bifunctional acetate--CoA ligase family protein/GNAT family N-acetyltransferase [Methylacidiphilum caldifontis]TFE69585.1 acetyl CoA synthetase subunit alpha [Methylacidiphilum caldifontis]